MQASNSARASSQYTAWTLLLTFAGVVLLWYTLKATRDTLEQAEAAADQARLSTEATMVTLEATKQGIREENRAYIGLSHLGSPHPDMLSHPFSARIHAINTGKTPANDILLSSQVFLENFPLPEDHALPNDWAYAGSNGILYPNRDMDFGCFCRGLSAVEIAEVTKLYPHKRIYVVGHVTYTDIYGARWFEQVCSTIAYVPNGVRGEPATQHNKTGPIVDEAAHPTPDPKTMFDVAENLRKLHTES